MQKNVIMSVDHLSKDFVIRGKKLGEKSKLLHALSDVSFDIYEGETLGIIGESGCGKSTLGRCLVKLHKPSAGTITYNGKDLWNLPVYEREAPIPISVFSAGIYERSATSLILVSLA